MNSWGAAVQQAAASTSARHRGRERAREASAPHCLRTREAQRQAVYSTQEDPIGLAGGANLYGYSDGDPINLWDPFGLCSKNAGGDGATEETSDCPRGSSGWWANRDAAGEGSHPVNITLGSFAALWEKLNEDTCPECTKSVFNVPVGGRITGFTKHGINQAISNDGVGVSGEAMLDAVANPLRVIYQAGGKIAYIGQNARVVLNSAGKVITTFARNRKSWRIRP